MKSWTLALIMVMTPVTGWTQSAPPTQANSSADLMSFFDDLFDGTNRDNSDLTGLLESFLGQAETANIDLGEILGRLEAIDISAVTDEIEALRQEFDLGRRLVDLQRCSGSFHRHSVRRQREPRLQFALLRVASRSPMYR
jgi:hypothetical protein